MRSLLTLALSNFKKMSTKAIPMVNYVWIDLEMTGLNVMQDSILEIACIITTTDLICKDEGISYVIHQPDEVLESMNDWCLVQHAKSGLTEKSRKSKISLSEADKLVSDYIKSHTDPQGKRYLAGNSVYMDKKFLERYMPFVDNLLHYRLLDVSSIKILCSHWYPDVYSKIPEKNITHRSLDDIKNSINELKEYRKVIFRN